jgi:SAM-dependent methyltransferase
MADKSVRRKKDRIRLGQVKWGVKMTMDQKQHWEEVYEKNPEFFGEEPSVFAREALELFQENGVSNLLELGPGQGRDTIFFAENGIAVTAVDYSHQSIAEINTKATARGVSSRVNAQYEDLRQPLPFPDGTFDACYSHMLLCMHLTKKDITLAVREIHRVLRPDGLAAYSVRNTFDPHYGYRGAKYLGEQIYEVGGFVVHFFNEEMIRKLASGFEITTIGRLNEGSLPRDLFTVFMKKAGPIEEPIEEESMSDVFGAYQSFFDATYAGGVLDKKTKFLIAMGASLAAGCDS